MPITRMEGETSETPMVEAKLRFEQDLYGKAGWYGKPRAFYVGLGAGYFRSRNQALSLSNTHSNYLPKQRCCHSCG